MNAPQTALVALAISAGLVAGAVLAWSLSKRWYDRHLAAARAAATQSDQYALAAQKQAAIAGQEIKTLTAELAIQKMAVAETERLLQMARETEQALLRDAEIAAAARQGADTGHGFPDTQLLS